MARVALIKLFTGLNLGVSQLSGELQRAGHDSRIIYFKDFLAVPLEEAGNYLVSDYPGVAVAARAKEYVWNAYRPFSEHEYDLLIGALRDFRPDLIGFSLTALVLKPAAEVTKRLKQHFDCPIIWGGPGPTLEPDRCIEHTDMLCINEGEELIVELARRIDAKQDPSNIPGLWMKVGDQIVKNTPPALLDVEKIAIPEFDPAHTLYINDDQLRTPIYPPNLGSQYIIMTTRGCPFSCSFCIESVYQDMFGKKDSLRRRSVDLVIQELVQAKQRLNIKSVMFYDDVFTTHPRWLAEFAPRYKAEVGLPFWCYTYPTTTRPQDLALLRDAGCVSMTMGVQSGSANILRDNFNRPVDQQRAIDAGQMIVDAGIKGFFDLITRVQFEKEEDLRATFDFLVDFPLGMQSVGFGNMTMFPTYGYTQQVRDEGADLTVSDKDYQYYHKLYLLTRTSLPRGVVRAIGTLPIFRRYPALIDPFLPTQLPNFFIDDGEDVRRAEILDLGHAQAVIPGGSSTAGCQPVRRVYERARISGGSREVAVRIQLLNPPTLINPKTLNTSRPTPPLGLAYIAGTLRHAGHDCTVIDAIAEAPAQRLPVGQLERLGLSDNQILERIDPQTRALAIGCMFSFGWPMLRGLIHAVRARFPEMLIVCGGEHFSALTEQCMATAPIDYIVVGEGEEIAVELFAQLDGNLPFDPGTLKGIAWRRGDTVVVNPRADRMKAIDELSWPAWDLFDLEAYNDNDLVGGLSFGKVVPILATRGCPYQCTYCSSPQMWTTRWHTRRPELVADEIEHYHSRYGANNFPFQDLTMIVKRDWIISFCNEIIRRNLDIRWQLPSGTRCEVVDDEVAELLQRSGCRWLCYAPESGSERTRELIKKRMKTESLLGAVESSVRAGLHLSTFFVIGFPHDNADDMRATAGLLRELARRGVEDIAVSFFPIPSTELYTSLLQRGRVRPDDDGLMSPLFAQQPTLVDERNFCDHLSAAQLNRWKLWLAANFYVTAWATHPTRVLRIAWNALRGKQTSSMEKLLSDRIRRLVRRRAPRQVPSAAPDSEARPSQAA